MGLGLPRPIAQALDKLGLELGPPLRLDVRQLKPATCLKCRRLAWWHWNGTPFEWEHDGEGPILVVHGCYLEDEP